MKLYRLSLFDSLIILNSQDLKSDFFDSHLEGSTLSRNNPRCATPEVPCGPSHRRKPRPSAPDLAADHQLGGAGDLPGLAWCNSSGRRRFQRPGKHIAERLGLPAAKALDVARHNVERTRREARLDADGDVDDLHGQTRLRQSGAQLLFRDGEERERPASDFGDEGRAFRTRQALRTGSVVDRAGMAVADQDSGCGGRHVTARNESNPVLG